jgi:hypothetical protein
MMFDARCKPRPHRGPRRQLLRGMWVMCTAPLVTAEGRLAATWAGNLDVAQAATLKRLWSAAVATLSHSLQGARVRGIRVKEAESWAARQAASVQRNRKGPWLT